jgi:RNA polymerase sigma-70 factor (ECF subfamily)
LWAELTDAELVVGAQRGYLAAFDELVRRFRPAVRLTARRYAGSEEAVEDLSQEAFLRAFTALARLEEPARFGGWLHAITRNLALRERQNGARHQARFLALDQPLLEEQVAPGLSPSEAFEQTETCQEIVDAIESLPLPYRDVIYLHYWEGMPASRVAAYLGVPLTTAKWRLRYARERLRQRLKTLGDKDHEEPCDE